MKKQIYNITVKSTHSNQVFFFSYCDKSWDDVMAEIDQTSFNSIHPFLDEVTKELVADLLREHQVTDGADLMKLLEMRSGPFKGSAMLKAHQKETGHHNRSSKKGAVLPAQAGMKPVNAIRGGTVDSDVESSAASSSATDDHINVAESDVQYIYIEASMTDNKNIPSSDVDQVALVDFSILKGVKLEVPCNTLEQEDSEKYFGVGCELKSTEAEVTRVVKPASHHPTFSLRFPARKATFSGYSLQYVFRHATEISNSLQKLHAYSLTSPKFTKDVVNDTKF